MKVSEAPSRVGLPVKTLHYYASIGLITPRRLDNGYRDYDADLVRKLRFLQTVRGLGFGVEVCGSPLSLYEARATAMALSMTS